MRRLWITFASLILGIALLQAQSSADLVHTVGAGETLTSIANAYGVSLEQLLTLNELDPEQYLQVGQRLLILRAGEGSQAESPSEDNDASEVTQDSEVEIKQSELPLDDDENSAVLAAAAPMTDPAAISPQLCVAIFQDDNSNGMRDLGEVYLPGGSIRLIDLSTAQQLPLNDILEAAPYCLPDLPRALYQLEGIAPDRFALTSSASLQVDLRAGGTVAIEFGVKAGEETFIVPAIDPGAAQAPPLTAESNILSELSGLFALSLAAVVLFSGLSLSLFLRAR